MRNIIIITGASSGMGAEFARQIFEAEEKKTGLSELWLIARSTEKLESLKATLTGKTQVKTISMDLTGKAGSDSFADLLLREKASGDFTIDTLINNAGFGTYGPFEETPVDRELEMIELNCTSLTGICGHAIPFLTKGSRIINVASLASFMPLGNFAVYAATKSYVLSFTVALAAELKPKGIKVSALCPGSVSTNFANVASNGVRKEVLHGRDPVKVVRHCLKKSAKDKKIILTFPKWKFTAFLSRLVGRFLVADYTFKHAKRPH